ncbi:hypothetical protein [Archangium lansingense]|uniref:Uncharacterized protein n=1 Tax=Archangium lansingense TaxID=2995310 RepID=A0ABT4A4U9_9BACT|nr:hypothetical protein [Archangium lansinium]MCY1076279.1 hypothetical protein [Archangium lansinium]
MRGTHGGGSGFMRLFGVGLAVAGPLLGVGSARAQGVGEGALACFQRAEREVSLTEEQALRLCRGSWSVGPAECYSASQAPATFLSTENAIELCRCATSIEPVNCFRQADHDTFLDTMEILQLCSPSVAYALQMDCQPGEWPRRPYGWP